MATREDYAPVMAALEAAGFTYSLRNYGEKGCGLVCVGARSIDEDESGPSFWLMRASSGRWFFAEWGGHPAFALPADADPATVCAACLRAMGECMAIPPEIISEFRLIAIERSQVIGMDLAEG